MQTPTLAILVEREKRIKAFVSKDYWEVEGEFQCVAGTYKGRWFDEKFKKKEDDEHARAERLWDKAKAEAIRKACLGQHGTVEEESKPKTEACPMLYDLTSLQREANGRFGFSAKNTLGLAQALYEKHKVLTYPRTDARRNIAIEDARLDAALRQHRNGKHSKRYDRGQCGLVHRDSLLVDCEDETRKGTQGSGIPSRQKARMS